MLESIEIKNFRSCEDVKFRLGEPLIALLGKNGAGKTNVLHAIQLAAQLCIGESDVILGVRPRNPKTPTCFELQFSTGEISYRYQVARKSTGMAKDALEEKLECNREIIFNRNGETLESPMAALEKTLQVGTRVSSLAALMQFLPKEHPAQFELSKVAEYLRAVRYYALRQGFRERTENMMPAIIEESRYEQWKERRSQGRTDNDAVMKLLHMKLVLQDRLDELSKLVGEQGLGLVAEIRIDKIQVISGKKLEQEPAYSVSFVPCHGLAGAGRPFRFKELSEGTMQILMLVTSLVFDESSCMLIEQPEDCIHAGLLEKVIDILKTYSDRTQLICTTHSAQVMNLIGPEGIRVVTADDGNTKVSELTESEIDASKSYLADQGTLSEFLETL